MDYLAEGFRAIDAQKDVPKFAASLTFRGEVGFAMLATLLRVQYQARFSERRMLSLLPP